MSQIGGLLANWPGDEAYAIVNDRWLVTRDSLIWPFYPRGSWKIPGDPTSGVWNSDRVAMWNGYWRKDSAGQWNRCTVGLPLGPGQPTLEEYRVRGFLHPSEAERGPLFRDPKWREDKRQRDNEATAKELGKEGVSFARKLMQAISGQRSGHDADSDNEKVAAVR